MEAPSPTRDQQNAGQRAQAPSVSGVSLDKMFRAATVAQQIMTDFKGLGQRRQK
jgi:hypothetical protein